MADEEALMADERITQVIEVQEAEEFFQMLLPTSPFFAQPGIVDVPIFRGVSNAEHQLVPSSLRDGMLAEIESLGGFRLGGNDERFQYLGEFGVLAHFFRIADSRGLPIPDDTRQLRGLLQHPFSAIARNLASILGDCTPWIPDYLLSLAALAQHYGLPTRLLDWTRNSRVAMYFAAIGGVNYLFKIQKIIAGASQSGTSGLILSWGCWTDQPTHCCRRG